MAKLLDESVESAKLGQSHFKPPVKSEHKNNAVRLTTMPSYKENMVTIYSECDPVRFLTDVAQGKPIACYHVDSDGNVQQHFETPTLSQRIKINTYLANKIMPPITQTAGNERASDPKNNRSFAQLIEHAADKIEDVEIDGSNG
jgi:hypothetical protein